uniref:Uncharacterized protein n=1 Tax=Lotharella vacuolata TaxID=74820 RepID=A0A0H5BHD7_9EUKA|nr:hypothetical protein [Lotharella vacuolata]
MIRKRNLLMLYNNFKTNFLLLQKKFEITISKKFKNKIYINNSLYLKLITKKYSYILKPSYFYINESFKNTKKYYCFVYNGLILKKIFFHFNIFLYNYSYIHKTSNLIV